MNPISITMVTLNLQVGGLERVVVDMTLALAEQGHKLSVIALRGGGPLEEPLKNAGVELQLLNCGDGLRVAYLQKLATALARLAPDLVHSHGEAALFYCGAQRLLSSVGIYRGFAHVHSRHGYEDVSTKGIWRNRIGHAGCDQVVCVSQDLANHCRDNERVPDSKLHTVINGVNLKPYRALADLTFVEGKPVIGHVARLAEVKNQTLLLRAFAVVVKQMPAAQLSVVGDGPERAALTKLSAELGIENSVTFHGETSDVPNKLRETHIFCLSSDSEGTPVSVIEALAAGRPVVATSVGGLPALVSEDAGVLSPAGDAQALGTALLKVYANKESYLSYQAGARNAPAGQHDAEAMLESYLEIYAKALKP